MSRVLERYFEDARRPLHILLFVAPLVIAYEVGLLLLYPRHPDILLNLAHEGLLRIFSTLGVTIGLGLPGFGLIVVLLLWQILSRDPWRPRWAVPLFMAVESLISAMPLLVAAQLLARVVPAMGGEVDGRIAELDIWSKLVISLGAGLYEELVFRMLLIAVIHTVLVDVGRASHAVGAGVAIAISAAVFTWYHPLAGPDGIISLRRVAFFAIAGVYFGVLFVMRGFGIAVGAHVAYDAIVALWLLE